MMSMKKSIIRASVGKKNPSLGFTVCHHSASLVMPNGDPKDDFSTLLSHSWFFYDICMRAGGRVGGRAGGFTYLQGAYKSKLKQQTIFYGMAHLNIVWRLPDFYGIYFFSINFFKQLLQEYKCTIWVSNLLEPDQVCQISGLIWVRTLWKVCRCQQTTKVVSGLLRTGTP